MTLRRKLSKDPPGDLLRGVLGGLRKNRPNNWQIQPNFSIFLVSMAGFTSYLSLFTEKIPRGSPRVSEGLRTVSAGTSLLSHTVHFEFKKTFHEQVGRNFLSVTVLFSSIFNKAFVGTKCGKSVVEKG